MERRERRGGLKRKINRLETIYIPRGESAVGVGKEPSGARSDKFSTYVLNSQEMVAWVQRHPGAAWQTGGGSFTELSRFSTQ